MSLGRSRVESGRTPTPLNHHHLSIKIMEMRQTVLSI
jgi:hypothetical protein